MIAPPGGRSSRRTWLIRSGGVLLACAPVVRRFTAALDVAAQGTTTADLPISAVMATLSAYMGGARERALPAEVPASAGR